MYVLIYSANSNHASLSWILFTSDLPHTFSTTVFYRVNFLWANIVNDWIASNCFSAAKIRPLKEQRTLQEKKSYKLQSWTLNPISQSFFTDQLRKLEWPIWTDPGCCRWPSSYRLPIFLTPLHAYLISSENKNNFHLNHPVSSYLYHCCYNYCPGAFFSPIM